MHFTTLFATLALLAPLAQASKGANEALIRARAVAPVLYPTPSAAPATTTHRRHHSKAAHGHKHVKSHKKTHKAKKGKRQDATVKCDSTSTWSLCGNGSCTFMGPVAAGTECINGAMATAGSATTAPSKAAAVESTRVVLAAAPKSSDQASSTDAPKSTPTVEPVVAAAVAPVVSIVSSVVAAVPSVTVLPLPSSTPAPAPAAPSTSSGDGPFTGGKGTFYNQEGGTGACGHQFTDADKIVALDLSRYGTGSNNAADCGRTVSITNTANGKTVQAVVADACPGCSNFNSIDLSVAAFNAIADPSVGVIGISWSFVN